MNDGETSVLCFILSQNMYQNLSEYLMVTYLINDDNDTLNDNFQSCESQTKVEHPWVIIASAAGCRVSCVKQLGCLALQVARFTCLMIPKVELHMLSHCLIQVGMKNYMNCHELHTIDITK